MTLANHFQLNGRAAKFYSRVFLPKYTALQDSVRQTPLVIMLWGPRRRSDDWSRKRMDWRDALQQLGHTVFFSEELGNPTSAMTKKGVEFLSSEMADLVVVIQSSYDPIGAVRHFVEFRVIDAKMLLFIDETAPDQRLYEHALQVLHSLYHNIHTYKYPDDLIENHLFDRLMERVAVMQMAKYRAIQNVSHWGLRAVHAEPGFGRTSNITVQPFDHNLLELYRNHRAEVDVLTNPGSLFLLAYINSMGSIHHDTLAGETGMRLDTLRQELAVLLSGEMITEVDGIVVAARFGKHLIHSVDMVSADNVILPRKVGAFRLQRDLSLATRLGSAMAMVAVVGVAMWYALTVQERYLPISFTPTNPPPARTATPTLVISPSPNK